MSDPQPEPTPESELKARLLSPRVATESGLPEEDYEIPGVGTIRIRALNRRESLMIKDANVGKIEIGKSEILCLKWGVISPKLTESDIRQWQAQSFGNELDNVVNRISVLSGFMEETPKEIYKSV